MALSAATPKRAGRGRYISAAQHPVGAAPTAAPNRPATCVVQAAREPVPTRPAPAFASSCRRGPYPSRLPADQCRRSHTSTSSTHPSSSLATYGRRRSASDGRHHEPKSRSAMRTVALPLPLVASLRRHRQAQLEERMLAGSLWEDNGLVFAQPNGRPLDPDRHTAAWNQFLAKASVRPARLHDARHTAATLLLVQGVDSRTVMALMGWSHIAMTTRYHVVPELRRAVAERMGEVLWDRTATKTATTRNRGSGHSWC